MRLLTKYSARFVSFFLSHSPVWFRNFLGDLIGILWIDIVRFRRDIVMGNLKKAFPKMSDSERTFIGRRSLRNMGRGLIEYCYFRSLNKTNYTNLFEFEGMEHFDKALEGGKGVALLSLHLGNGDLAAAALSLRGYPLNLISKEFKIAWLNEMWFGLRGRLGTKFIPPRNSSYAILKALKRNESVIFVLDQFMGPPIGVKTTFFGYETGTAMGLAVIAKRAGVPVIPIYTYRLSDGRHKLVCEAPIEFEEKESKEFTLSFMTQKYTHKLEEIISKHPDQWMWVHRRWKKFVVT